MPKLLSTGIEQAQNPFYPLYSQVKNFQKNLLSDGKFVYLYQITGDSRLFWERLTLKTEAFPNLLYPLKESLLLVGMMGCGKSTLGGRFAKACRIPFVDADVEIEKAAGCSVADLFALYGEEEFRRGEERVMERLLNGPRSVIAAGGGSFLSERTRALAKTKTVSVFLDADTSTLIRNTAGRTHRPLLNTENPEERLKTLLEERRGVYEQADIVLSYKDETAPVLMRRLMNALNDYVRKNG